MFTRRTTLALLASTLATPALAAAPPVFQDNRRIAINGYDPVAYFNQSRPVAGAAQFQAEYNGAIWQFASAENRAAFAQNPTRFAPKYGGYCAYAASKGALAPTIPEAWTVYDNALYLNANLRARGLWKQDIPGNIRKANGFWPGILG